MRHAGALGAVASIGGAIVVTLASTGILATSEANAPLNDDHQQRVEPGAIDVNVAFALRRSTVARLDIGETPNVPILVEVPIEGEVFTLDLQPHSLRAETYQVLVQMEDGSLVEVEPEPIRTLRGVVVEDPASIVAGSLLADGLHAAIHFTNGDLYWLEPIGSRIPGAAANDYVVYHNDDVLETGGVCGIDALQPFPNIAGADGGAGVAGGGCGNDLYIAQLGCDSDVEYFNDYGSVAAVQNRINLVINTVNLQYENQVQITHEITTIIVRMVSGPYTSTNPVTLLNQFQNEWTTTQAGVTRDVAHLFTGKNIDGNVIGIAWNIAVVCVFQQHYCLSQSDYNNNFSCATDLTTHELGHLWGADHCGSGCNPPTNCLACGFNTMRCAITCANNFHATCTRPEIIAHRNSRTCLDCDPGIVGACCFGNGSCSEETQADCISLGGTYQGDGTSCSPNPCPQPPTGACCFGNGSCSEETQADCISFGGTYQGDDTICSPNPCPQPPTGACCLPGDFCAVISSFTCTDLGGTYQGNGTNCSPDPCVPPTGACCLSDGTCLVVNPDDCNLISGIYQGDGSDCSPNPCSPPTTGACCFLGGSCSVETQADCKNAGGAYQGDRTDCANVTCRQCLSDADCDDGNPCNGLETCVGGICQPGTPPNCDDGNPCTEDTCIPGVGCVNDPVPLDGTPCDDGVFCTNGETCSGGVCAGGTLTDCDDGNPCTLDTCDPVLEVCISTPITPCCDNGVPEAGEDCENCPADVQCPPDTECIGGVCEPLTGACCFSDCSCTVETLGDCNTLGGSYQGDGSNCSPNNCPAPSADFTGPVGVPDGCVDAFDLGAMLAAWCSGTGDPNPPSPPCENCNPAILCAVDISGPVDGAPDGCVDAFDLAKLLAAWCSVAGGNPCGTCGP
ncbi:MAG: M12 family metallo-peptidase [Planctomycetota bacterium]|nr:M12 family metallo-peptidase [Planctomycetota bacterium]